MASVSRNVRPTTLVVRRFISVMAFVLFLLFGPASCMSDIVVEMHGSGTTNPSRYIWKVMDLFQERSRVPIRTTYRAIGSGNGQLEFLGQASNGFQRYTHFGSGDIPVSKGRHELLSDNGRAMLHVPFAVGAVSFFHSIPGLPMGKQGLNLTACVLAKILQRDVKTWDDAEILAINPNLQALSPSIAGQDIKVVRRVHGSSSTAGITSYIADACPGTWRLGSGSSISWPADTIAAEGSGGVTANLQATAYAIGYLDSGTGHSANLVEIELRNKNGFYLNSKEADIGATVTVALDQNIIPSKPDADFSAVSLHNLEGNSTWPITSLSYFYLDKDYTSDSDSGTLTKAFVNYVLSEAGQAMLSDFGFIAIPPQLKAYNSDTLANYVTVSGNEWTFESGTQTDVYDGAGSHVISEKRRSYGEYQRTAFDSQLASLDNMMVAMTTDHETMMADHAQLALLSQNLTEIRASVDTMTADHSTMMADHLQLAVLSNDLKILTDLVAKHKQEKHGGQNKPSIFASLAIGVLALLISVINLVTLHKSKKDLMHAVPKMELTPTSAI